MISIFSLIESQIASGSNLPAIPKSSAKELSLGSLRRLGFNDHDLELIKSQIPDLNLKVLIFSEDNSAKEISKDALELYATVNLPVVLKVRGKVIIVNQETVPSKLEDQCNNLKLLERLESISLDSKNQTGRHLNSAFNEIYRSLPRFIQDWIDDRILHDDLGPKSEIIKIGLDAFKLYVHFNHSRELIDFWNRVRESKMKESDPKLLSNSLILAAKIVMAHLET